MSGYLEMNPDAILDGELYNHRLRDNFNKIVSLVRKQTPNKSELIESKELIQFHWYDIVSERKQSLRDALRKDLWMKWVPAAESN